MERQDYLKLRLEVEQEISAGLHTAVDVDVLTNSVMRLFLQSISSTEVKRQTIAKQFKNFKRSSDTTTPSWAYKNPGLCDRIPTLKEA